MENDKLVIAALYKTNYPNDSSPMASRLHLYMRALKNTGAKVIIIIPTFEEKKDYSIDDIKYQYEYIKNPSLKGNIKEANIELLKKIAPQYDVIFTSISDDSWVKYYVEAIQKVKGKMVIEMNENPHSIVGSRKDFKIILFLKRLYFLHFVANRLDGLIVISRKLESLFSTYKGVNTKVIRIPVLCDLIQKKDLLKVQEKIPYILHAGSLSEQKDGIKAMLKAFKIAHDELQGKLRFIFTLKIGFPGLINWIDNFIKVNNLEEFIEFKGFVNREELNELYAGCSLAIINKPINVQNNYNFPTKLTELIPRKIPIIVSETGELDYYFKHNLNCYKVIPNDYLEIAKGIMKILSDRTYADEISENAVKLAETEFYFDNYGQKLFDYFLKVKNA